MYPNSVIYLSGIFIHEQVKELKKLGVDVEVVAWVPWSPPILRYLKRKWKLLAKIPPVEVLDDITVYHPRYIAFPKGFLKGYWPRICLASAVRFFRRKGIKLQDVDLFHAQGALPEDYAGYLLAKRFDKPFVLTVHGGSVYATIRKKSHFKKSKIAILNADAVIAVSRKVKERIEKFTGRRENVYVVYNGFKSKEVKETIKKEPNEIVLLFGATLIERKGCIYLLRAFARLLRKYANLKLWIAGGGPLLEEMKKASHDLGVEASTYFWGTVSHEKMLALMSSCDIFVLPSWDEAFGVVYLEAMSFKKPIIGVEGEGISDIVEDGNNGLLVKPRDVNSLVEKLTMLVENEELRREIGLRGYETTKKMTWRRNAELNIEIYRKVLKNG
jgi:glycosyltransferase involved in cell wall biosynthesis